MKLARPLLAACAALALAAPALAHEFWLRPSRFRAPVDEEVELGLFVGDRLRGEPFPRSATHLARFVSRRGRDEPQEVAGLDGETPAGYLPLEAAGMHVVGYAGQVRFITLEAAKFEPYLREKGLEHVVRARADAGSSDAPGREAYVRCAKTLVLAGGDDADDAGFDLPLGLEVEIVPESDPLRARPGDTLTVRVLRDGAALAGVLVEAHRGDGEEHAVTARRTGEDGRARIVLPHAGFWLVSCVDMRPAPEELREKADWRSVWASLSFEVREPQDAAAEPSGAAGEQPAK